MDYTLKQWLKDAEEQVLIEFNAILRKAGVEPGDLFALRNFVDSIPEPYTASIVEEFVDSSDKWNYIKEYLAYAEVPDIDSLMDKLLDNDDFCNSLYGCKGLSEIEQLVEDTLF